MDNGIDPDVAAFGQFMERLAEAVEAAGADIRDGLETLADAVRLGAVKDIVGDADWERD